MECTECEAGKYSTAIKAVGCTSATTCGAGTRTKTASTTTSDTVCEDCTAGKYSIGDAVECTECEAGKYSTAIKAVGCTSATTCAAGTKIKEASTSTSDAVCEDCPEGKYSNGALTACQDCYGGGWYADKPKSSVCKTAPAGHKPNTDRTGIDKCPSGTFSVGASDDCDSCKEDETSPEGAAGCSTCATCAVGRYKIADCTSTTATQCGDCPAGQASMGGEATACTECNRPGQYSDTPLSGVCKLAPAGYKPSSDRTNIEQCPKNTFTIGASDDCTDCTDGGHSLPGSSACEKCSSGKYYIEDANVCGLCPSGTSTATGGVGLAACEKCPEGFFSSSSGASTCFACQAGKYTNQDQTDCLQCAAGKISGVAAPVCSVCDVGKYAEGEGNVECKFCDDEDTLVGSITLTNGTTTRSGCLCPAGEFVLLGEDKDEDQTCAKVPEGVKTTVDGLDLENLDIKKGFWRTSKNSSDIVQCMVEEHCLGGNETDKQCKKGHKGPMCGACSPGHASIGSGPSLKCVSCEDGNAEATVFFGFAVFAFFVGLLMVISCCCCGSGKKRNQANAEEDDVVLASNDSMALGDPRSRTFADRANSNIEKVDTILSIYAEAKPYIKIVLSYYQIVGGLGFAFDVQFPPMFTKAMSYVASVVNLQVSNTDT